MSFWRAAGMNFAQYLQVANSAARQCVKPEYVKKYQIREQYNYIQTVWENKQKVSTQLYTSFEKKF